MSDRHIPVRGSHDVGALMTIPSQAATGGTPPATGGELILSEERLSVSTRRVPTRRVRLEKFVVTETRTVTVEVSHEEIRLVEVDIDENDTSEALHPAGSVDAPDVGRWMTLSEERIAITTETVPVERVRLDVTSVTEQRSINEDVRREDIAFDPGTDRAAPQDVDTVPDATLTAKDLR